MKNSLLKKALVFIAIGVILCCSMIPAFAIEQKTQTGSLNITMELHGKPISGGLVALYYVAELNDDESYSYTQDFSSCGIPLSDLNDKELPQKLLDYAQSNDIKVTVREVNPEGKVTFNNLKEGLYLVAQAEKAAEYKVITPFLVEIPYYNAETSQWEYDVEAKPKLTPDSPDIPITNPAEPTTQQRPTEPEIPHTGQLNWPIPVLAFAGILIFIIGWYLYYTKGKK